MGTADSLRLVAEKIHVSLLSQSLRGLVFSHSCHVAVFVLIWEQSDFLVMSSDLVTNFPLHLLIDRHRLSHSAVSGHSPSPLGCLLSDKQILIRFSPPLGHLPSLTACQKVRHNHTLEPGHSLPCSPHLDCRSLTGARQSCCSPGGRKHAKKPVGCHGGVDLVRRVETGLMPPAYAGSAVQVSPTM